MIEDIARDAFVLDQYHSDEWLPSELCDKYYAKWASNCCGGFSDKVMVLTKKETVVGFITLNFIEDDTAVVGLAAIHNKYRGKGFFTYLIEKTLHMLYKEGVEYLLYGTQLTNIPVLHTMGKFSGTPEYSKHVLHLKI